MNHTALCSPPSLLPQSSLKGEGLFSLLHFSKSGQTHLFCCTLRRHSVEIILGCAHEMKNLHSLHKHRLFVSWVLVLIYLCFSIHIWDSLSDWGKCGGGIFFLFLFSFVSLFILRESVCAWPGEGRERGRERILSRFRTISAEPNMGLDPRTVRSWPEVKSSMLINRLSHLAPPWGIFDTGFFTV